MVITMPRTAEELRQAAADAERWLDSLDPAAIAAPEADASDLRTIAEKVRGRAQIEAELAEAVATARRNGRTWTQIAVFLGVTKQSARERFGEPASQR